MYPSSALPAESLPQRCHQSQTWKRPKASCLAKSSNKKAGVRLQQSAVFNKINIQNIIPTGSRHTQGREISASKGRSNWSNILLQIFSCSTGAHGKLPKLSGFHCRLFHSSYSWEEAELPLYAPKPSWRPCVATMGSHAAPAKTSIPPGPRRLMQDPRRSLHLSVQILHTQDYRPEESPATGR